MQLKPEHLKLKISKLTSPGPNQVLVKKNKFVFFEKGSRNKRVSLVSGFSNEEDSRLNKSMTVNKTILNDIESLRPKHESSRTESLKNLICDYGTEDGSTINNSSDFNIDLNGHLKKNRTKMESMKENVAAVLKKTKIRAKDEEDHKLEKADCEREAKSKANGSEFPPLGLYHPRFNIVSTKSPSWKISQLQRFPEIKNPYWSQEEREIKNALKKHNKPDGEYTKRVINKEDDSEFQRDFSRMMNSLKKEAEHGTKNKKKLKKDPVIEKHEELFIKPIESDEYLYKFHSDMKNGIKQVKDTLAKIKTIAKVSI